MAPNQAAPTESMGMWLLPTCPDGWVQGQAAGTHGPGQGVAHGHEAPGSSSRVGWTALGVFQLRGVSLCQTHAGPAP